MPHYLHCWLAKAESVGLRLERATTGQDGAKLRSCQLRTRGVPQVHTPALLATQPPECLLSTCRGHGHWALSAVSKSAVWGDVPSPEPPTWMLRRLSSGLLFSETGPGLGDTPFRAFTALGLSALLFMSPWNTSLFVSLCCLEVGAGTARLV